MKIAVIQLNAGEDKKKNVEKAVNFVEKAVGKKAKVIILPEGFNFRGKKMSKESAAVAESIPGPSINPFIEIAKKQKVFILAGSIWEKSREKEKAYNATVLISPKGALIKYRKRHLFRACLKKNDLDETRIFLSGQKNVITKVLTFNVGLAICFDLRFSEQFNFYFKKNVDVICLPSNFTQETGEAHWEVLLRARAIETQSYVLAANQCGADAQGVCSYGNSMIISPWGEILARASFDKEEILWGEINRDIIIKTRKKINMKEGC